MSQHDVTQPGLQVRYERMSDGALVAVHTHQGRSVAAIVHPHVESLREVPQRRWVLAGDLEDRAHRPKGQDPNVATACAEAAQALGVELGVGVAGWSGESLDEAKRPDLTTFYVTFPVGGVLRDCYSTIAAATEHEARLRIIEVYGRGDPEGHSGFGGVYRSAEQAGVDRYDLELIPFGTLTLGLVELAALAFAKPPDTTVCYCGTVIADLADDEDDDGTCGAMRCRRVAAQDLQGLIP